jgi:hypothetical protein
MTKERSGMSRTLRGWLIVITGTLSVLAGMSAYRLIRAPRPAAVRPTEALAPVEVVVYKSATCECCGRWIEHLERAGMRVSVHVVENLAEPKARLGVPARLGSCHTATVAGYALEGHVPIEAIQRLLAEQPDVIGLAVPGMPAGAPGMETPTPPQPYQVLSIGRNGETATWLAVTPGPVGPSR